MPYREATYCGAWCSLRDNKVTAINVITEVSSGCCLTCKPKDEVTDDDICVMSEIAV